MEPILNLKQIAKAVSGELINCDENIVVSSVSTDTRTIKDGALFVALKGENLNGHRFIKNAIESGAVCAISDKDAEVDMDFPLILVENTSKALLDLALCYRKEMHIPLVAVTGSVGKTSTRGMIASVLSQKYKTLATEGNFNNEIGVPLTLFRLSREHEIAVIEMGMNHFGELSRITRAAQPDTAVITNIGEAHIENLGTREGILNAKLEVLEGLPPDGTVVLCGDNDMLWNLTGRLDFETIYYGIENEKCDIRAYDAKTYAESSEFKFLLEGKEYIANIGVAGAHHIYNALSAIVVGIKYNVPIEDIITGIKEFIPVGLRQAAVKLKKYTIIKDCYNASPTSMKSGLEVLSLKECDGRKVAILGDMLELGTISKKAHIDTGLLVPGYGVDCLITVGERGKLIAEGAAAAGLENIYSFNTNDEVCESLYDILKEGDLVLLKASRGMHLEEVAEYMEKNQG